MLKDIKRLASIALCVLAFSVFLAQLAHLHLHWLSDLFTHFQLQYIIGGVLLCLFFGSCKQWIRCALSCLLALISIIHIYMGYTFTPSETSVTAPSTTFKVLLQNRRYTNEEHNAFLRYIAEEDPDLILVQETTQSHSAAMNAIRDTYPHQIHEPRTNAFGQVVASKHPFRTYRVKSFKRIALDNIQINLKLDFEGRDISVYAIHPPPPMSKNVQAQRNMELAVTSQDITKDQSTNIIMAGDWNISPYSPHFKDVIRQTALKNEYKKPLLFQTWPSMFKIPILQIPIDHILHKGDLELVEKRRGPALGSDHYPVIATYQFSE